MARRGTATVGGSAGAPTPRQTATRPGRRHFRSRTVVAETGWGDVVVARSSGASPTSEADMVALVETVEPTDQDTWEDLVTEAAGGPGLNPDPGRQEVTRGTVGEVEWLLQTGPDRNPRGDDPPMNDVDECVKLSTRTRRCPTSSGGDGAGGSYFVRDNRFEPDPGDDLPDSVVVTSSGGTSVRATTPDQQVTAPLAEVPDSILRAAVLFLDDAGGVRGCDDPTRGSRPLVAGEMRLDLLDEEGQVVGCLG